MTEITLIVFPPEPPVAMTDGPERRTAGKGAPVFGAAERTLAGEHRSGIWIIGGRWSGSTILWFWLVSLRVGFSSLLLPRF